MRADTYIYRTPNERILRYVVWKWNHTRLTGRCPLKPFTALSSIAGSYALVAPPPTLQTEAQQIRSAIFGNFHWNWSRRRLGRVSDAVEFSSRLKPAGQLFPTRSIGVHIVRIHAAVPPWFLPDL